MVRLRYKAAKRVSCEVDSVRDFLKEIGKIPRLTPEEEKELGNAIYRWQSLKGLPNKDPEEFKQIERAGLKALDRFVSANLRFVVSIAKRYNNKGVDLLDLVQEGSIGLRKGAEKFDFSKGYKFSTYAYWWVLQSITRAIAYQSRTIRLPFHLQEKLVSLRRAYRQLAVKLNRTPTKAEIAEYLGWPLKRIETLQEFSRLPISLNLKVAGSQEEAELGDFIFVENTNPEYSLLEAELIEAVQQLLQDESLHDREREVLMMRAGIGYRQAMRLDEIGIRLGLSKERVRQIHLKAIRKLRSKVSQSL